MTYTVTETVRYWGTLANNGHIPHSLSDFMVSLDEAMNEIPREYRMTAEIDFEPDYEFGEHYGAVRVTYERPETPEEAAKRLADERAHWMEQLESARERVEYCTAQLDCSPVKRRV